MVHKTTIYLPNELRRDLAAKAKRTGVPQADLIRQALQRSLEEDEQPWPRSIGIASSGRFDARDDETVLEREWAARVDSPARRT